MQPLSHSSQGNTYTIKWMFGVPEVLDLMAQYQIFMKAVRFRYFRNSAIL